MKKLLKSRIGVLAVGVVLGVAVALLFPSGADDSAISWLGDRALLMIPGQHGGGGGVGVGASTVELWKDELPLTAAEAVAAGWKDPILCNSGQGRYFQQTADAEAVPYILIYDFENKLVGIYQYSSNEMPDPWKRVDNLTRSGRNVVDFEHWGLYLYLRDPSRACGKGKGGEVSAPAREARERITVIQSTPTPVVEPTATPVPKVVLEAAADKIAALKSISLTLTHEGDAQKLEVVVKLPDQVSLTLADPTGTDISLPLSFVNLGAILSDIARAIQDPTEISSAWIGSVRHSGISGTVLGQHLIALVPTAAADAKVTVKIWMVDGEGNIGRVRIEGAVAADDEPGVVRVLDIVN